MIEVSEMDLLRAENATLRGDNQRLRATLYALGAEHYSDGGGPVSTLARRIGPLSGRVAWCVNGGCSNHGQPIPVKHGRTMVCGICGTESRVVDCGS